MAVFMARLSGISTEQGFLPAAVNHSALFPHDMHVLQLEGGGHMHRTLVHQRQ